MVAAAPDPVNTVHQFLCFQIIGSLNLKCLCLQPSRLKSSADISDFEVPNSLCNWVRQGLFICVCLQSCIVSSLSQLLGLPFKTLFPEVKMAPDGSRPELSSRKYSLQMLICWKHNLLDNTWLMCSCCVCSRGLTPRLHRGLRAASSERPLGFPSSKPFPDSHWVVISL